MARIRAGPLISVVAVYLVAGRRLTSRAEILSASLWGGRAATVAGPAAAYRHGLMPQWTHRLDLVLPRAANRRRPPGILSMLRRAGLTNFVRGLPFGDDYEIDVAFPDAMVAIEFDGWAWHSDVARFRSDRRKGNLLADAGWTVLRFTWADFTERPDTVIRQIRNALARAAQQADRP